jgi:glycosyltransferase involved in cell wall biosynthesis
MKVLQVVPSINMEASGPSYSVPALCRALRNRDVKVALHVLEPAPVMPDLDFELHTHPWWHILPKLGISPAMRQALRNAAASADIMHNHSFWMLPNVYPAWAIRGTHCRLVTSPRGTLSPQALQSSRWLKGIMWKVCQGQAVKDSACLHATTEREFNDIRRASLRAPVAVIPNGVDLPDLEPSPDTPGKSRRLLFLGRIHPIKGIDYLLRAWRNVQDQFPDWELHVVGPDNIGYLNKMLKLSHSLGTERVSFPGPAYGAKKSKIYQQADLFVLPTNTENFAMAVAEALAHGVPAIVSKGAPWPGLEEHNCGWWIDIGEGPLTECLRTVLKISSEKLRAYGARGRDWMEREFSWSQVGQKMHETYLWVLAGGPPPGWVRTEF